MKFYLKVGLVQEDLLILLVKQVLYKITLISEQAPTIKISKISGFPLLYFPPLNFKFLVFPHTSKKGQNQNVWQKTMFDILLLSIFSIPCRYYLLFSYQLFNAYLDLAFWYVKTRRKLEAVFNTVCIVKNIPQKIQYSMFEPMHLLPQRLSNQELSPNRPTN